MLLLGRCVLRRRVLVCTHLAAGACACACARFCMPGPFTPFHVLGQWLYVGAPTCVCMRAVGSLELALHSAQEGGVHGGCKFMMLVMRARAFEHVCACALRLYACLCESLC